MSAVFLDSELVTVGNLQAVIEAVLHGHDEELAEQLTEAVLTEVSKRMDEMDGQLQDIETKLDRLTEHLGAPR